MPVETAWWPLPAVGLEWVVALGVLGVNSPMESRTEATRPHHTEWNCDRNMTALICVCHLNNTDEPRVS